MLRVAFFGSDGEFSCRSLEGVAARHTVVAIVAPPAPRRTLRSLLRSVRGGPRFSLARLARAPLYRAASGNDTVALAAISDTRPDVICIAGYPWLLPPDLFRKPPMGAINLHGSLLPRHRGILPLFWIYYHDDKNTGVTVHRVTDRADAGAILGQDSFPLARGFPVDRLNSMNAERGGALLTATLDALERGRVEERPQDERLATAAPRVAGGVAMVDFELWGAERVWHFLAGLYPRFQERGRRGEHRTLPGRTGMADGASRPFAGIRRTNTAGVGALLSRRDRRVMVTDVVALVVFAGFVIGALALCGRRPPGPASWQRKTRVSLFLVYTLGASFGAGLAQHDIWPFVAWPLVAARLPATVTEPRVVAVDVRGVDHDIDYRAWWPLSFDELTGWMNQDFLTLPPETQDRVAHFLVAKADSARHAARRGEAVGQYGRFLGPFAAPLFLLHPKIWSDSSRVPSEQFVGLRFYQESWNLETHAAGSSAVRRRLVYQFPAAP